MSDSLITKKAIAQCLKNLAAEKSFLKISIGDITAAWPEQADLLLSFPG